MKSAPMTIDKLIRQLEAMRAESKLGGGTCVYIMRPASGEEAEPMVGVTLDQDQDGALAYVLLPEGS